MTPQYSSQTALILRGMYQTVLQLKLCMDVQVTHTPAVPLAGSICKILRARGTRSQKTENITIE